MFRVSRCFNLEVSEKVLCINGVNWQPLGHKSNSSNHFFQNATASVSAIPHTRGLSLLLIPYMFLVHLSIWNQLPAATWATCTNMPDCFIWALKASLFLFMLHITAPLRNFLTGRPVERGGSFPGPCNVWGAPPSLKKCWKSCSRWLLSNLKHA